MATGKKLRGGLKGMISSVNDLDENFNRKASKRRKEISKNSLDDDLKSNDSNIPINVKHGKLKVATNKRGNSVSPRKKIGAIKTEQDALEIKQETSELKQEPDVYDIEDGGWRPDNWKIIWENILKMRKLYVAPVDSLGADECAEKDVQPEVFRYQTLISVILSSRTRDEVTHAATQRLIEHGLTVDNILNTSDEEIRELIKPVLYYNNKAQFIKKTTQVLKDKYNGDIPRTLPELCKLPGVGPKIANLVMSVGWNETVGIAVDTHVHRIANRLRWVPKETEKNEDTRKALESWLPKNLWKPVNIELVGFGQTICKPITPSCDICLNKTICPSAGKKSPKKKQKK